MRTRYGGAGLMGERLCSLMNSGKITLDKLAKATGVSKPMIERIRTGDVGAGLGTIIPIADYFSVPLDYFTGRMDEETAREIIADYPQNFMRVRRLGYEAYLRSGDRISRDSRSIAPWPYNLLEEITHEETKEPINEDQEDGLIFALGMLKDVEKEAILMYYKEDKTLNEIASVFGKSGERARQCIHTGIMKLRHKSRRMYFERGLKYVDELISLERKIKELKEKAEKAELEYEAELNRIEEKKKNLAVLEDRLNKSKANIKESLLDLLNNENEESGKEHIDIEVLNMKIKDLEFSNRVYNQLLRAGINTILDIVKYSREKSLKSMRNIGKKCIDEIHEKLNYFGVHWIDKYLGEM